MIVSVCDFYKSQGLLSVEQILQFKSLSWWWWQTVSIKAEGLFKTVSSRRWWGLFLKTS